MNSRKLAKTILKELHKQTGWLVPVSAAVGVAATAYLASKATLRASEEVRLHEEVHGVPADDTKRVREAVSVSWNYYIPAILTGFATVGVVSIGSYSMTKRTVAAVSAASLTEKAFSEYRRSVVEQIGERQEGAIRDQIAQKEISDNPPSEKNIVIVSGDKTVRCCELYTGRYFNSDMETLRRAENEINSRIIHELYVTLEEFYSLIGLPPTTTSGDVGWNSDKLMELEFATVLSDDTPCLTFKYNYVKPV